MSTPRVVALATLALILAAPGTARGQSADDSAAAAEAAKKQLLSRLGSALRSAAESRTIAGFMDALAKAKTEHGEAVEKSVRARALTLIETEQAERLAALGKAFGKEEKELRPRLERELAKRRNKALRLIFSKSSYPDKKRSPKGHAKAQVKVDAYLALVREIWTNPGRAIGAIDSSARTAHKRLAALRSHRRTLDPSAKDTTAEAVKKLEAALNAKIDLRMPAGDDTTSRLYDSHLTLRSNAKKTSVGTEAERALVKLTNEYRMMMGFAALRIDKSLMACASGHSAYMARTRKFAHNIAGHPNGVTPSHRAQKAGYAGLVAENIALGGGGPGRALDMWLHSAGHHRNILGFKHAVIGVGQSGDYWTQVFG